MAGAAAYDATVNCQSCGRALEPGTRFCPACGTPTQRACAACGTPLPSDAHFCPACGTPTDPNSMAADVKTAAVPAAPTTTAAAAGDLAEAPDSGRERKVATMVFADLVGFTSLNESADPELVQALVTRAFDRLSTEVDRYQGTIEKFAGDAMLAVFGVPAVHEDDAERAVRAALEMQAAVVELAADLRREGHPELSLRIGIETGEVLVDQGRASGERDRMVTGDAVNTAARLQPVAPPGAIVVGPSTYAACSERRTFGYSVTTRQRRSTATGPRTETPSWIACARRRRSRSARAFNSSTRMSTASTATRPSGWPICSTPSAARP